MSTEVLVIVGLFGVVAVLLLLGGFAHPDRHHRVRRIRVMYFALRAAVSTLGGDNGGPCLPAVVPSAGVRPISPARSGPPARISQVRGTLSPASGPAGSLGQVGTDMVRFRWVPGSSALPGLGYLGCGCARGRRGGGLIVGRRDRRLLLFGGVGIVAAVLSLDPGHAYWVPWKVLEKVPWVGNIVEIRFSIVLTLSRR